VTNELASRGVRRRESREEIVARVQREQEALHPAPVYNQRARRRLRTYLIIIWPLGMLMGLVTMWALGWHWIEGIGLGASLGLVLGYVGFVLLAERDDGRIQKGVRGLGARAAD
jgi:hypothetical protein